MTAFSGYQNRAFVKLPAPAAHGRTGNGYLTDTSAIAVGDLHVMWTIGAGGDRERAIAEDCGCGPGCAESCYAGER